MADDAQSTALAVAVGNLTGQMAGLAKTLEDQNKSSAANRLEFMEVFKGIRSDAKEQTEYLRKHIEEDSKVNQAVVELMTWKRDAEGQVKTLWDTKNKQAGAVGTMGILGSIVGGLLVATIDWVTRK